MTRQEGTEVVQIGFGVPCEGFHNGRGMVDETEGRHLVQ